MPRNRLTMTDATGNPSTCDDCVAEDPRVRYRHFLTFDETDKLAEHFRRYVPRSSEWYEDLVNGVLGWHRFQLQRKAERAEKTERIGRDE